MRRPVILTPGQLAMISGYAERLPLKHRDRFRRAVMGRLAGEPTSLAVTSVCSCVRQELERGELIAVGDR
jgi:hypothetical protein